MWQSKKLRCGGVLQVRCILNLTEFPHNATTFTHEETVMIEQPVATECETSHISAN